MAARSFGDRRSTERTRGALDVNSLRRNANETADSTLGTLRSMDPLLRELQANVEASDFAAVTLRWM